VSAVLALVLAAAAPLGGAEGRWQGSAAIGDREVAVAVDLAPAVGSGGWAGSIVLSGLHVQGAALSGIVVAPPRVAFTLASPRGERGLGAVFEARLGTDGRMVGTLAHAGRTSPVTLVRTGEAQVAVPLASTRVAAAAEGEWRGGYELFGYPRKVTLRLANAAAAASATFVIEGKRRNELPVDLVRQEGETVFVVSSATGIRFEGRLSADGRELKGAVLQGPLELPVVLRRADEKGASS
jgi:hypothetical protein